MRFYNWGLVGAGRISSLFSQGLGELERARRYAIGSRSVEKGLSFAEQHGFYKSYGNYAAMLADENVDIVYIGTPHPMHFENARAAIQAGKHVLCEKPLTMNAEEARELISLAGEKGVFFMEAMWTRFQPWVDVVREILDSGKIGRLLHLKADLSFRFEVDDDHRIFNKSLGGGALLDLGIYPVSLASFFLGTPDSIQAAAHMYPTGVDDSTCMIFTYESGAQAELTCSSRFTSKCNAILQGEYGRIEIPGMFHRPDRIFLQLENGDSKTIETPYAGNAYHYQAAAVMNMIDEAKLEHSLMSWDESLSIMVTMDEVRRQVGLVYP